MLDRNGIVVRGALSGFALGLVLLAAWIFSAAVARTQPPLQSQVSPSYKQFAPGLLARTRFGVDDDGRRVELWDLLVGPGVRSSPVSLPGDAVLEVRDGEGLIYLDKQEQRLRSGTVIYVPHRMSFEIANGRTDLAVSLRATIITGKPQ